MIAPLTSMTSPARGLRPRARRSRRLRLLALAATAALTATLGVAAAPRAQAAQPTALDVAPPDTYGAVAVFGLGALEAGLEQQLESLARMGVEDPGWERLDGWLRELVGVSQRGPLVESMGLAPAGALALYLVPVDGHPEVAVAADIRDRNAAIKGIKALVVADTWVPPGDKPPKVTVDRTRLPGGGLFIRAHIDDGRDLFALFQGGVMALGPTEAVARSLALGGGSRTLQDLRAKAVGPYGVLGHLEIAALAAVDRGFRDIGFVERAVGYTRYDGATFQAHLDVEMSPTAAPFLPLVTPSAAGAKSRAVMHRMAGEGSSWWMRLSLDPSAALAMAEGMLGPGVAEFEVEFRERMGLDLRKDLVDVFTGDILLSSRETMADITLGLGVTDSRRAVRTVSKGLEKLASLDEDLKIVTKRVRGAAGERYRTESWLERPEQGTGEREAHMTYHWGVRDGVLLVGLTPEGVDEALARDVPRNPKASMLGKTRGFGPADVLAAYSDPREMLGLLHHILPIVRGLFPGETVPGLVTRVVDALVALSSMGLDSTVVVEREGLGIHAVVESRGLPVAGAAGHVAAAHEAFEEAIALRTIGRYRSSNEALLALAEQYPGTPYAERARTMALAGDDASVLLTAAVMAAQGFWFFMMLDGLGKVDEHHPDEHHHEEAVPVWTPAPGLGQAQCGMLESMACGPDAYDGPRCAVARAGVASDCDVELQALLGGP